MSKRYVVISITLTTEIEDSVTQDYAQGQLLLTGTALIDAMLEKGLTRAATECAYEDVGIERFVVRATANASVIQVDTAAETEDNAPRIVRIN